LSGLARSKTSIGILLSLHIAAAVESITDIGINPQNDGSVIRLTFPQLTEDRRKELVKDIKKMGEECKVAIRSIRRDAMEKFKAMKKNNEITEDDLKDCEDEIQKLTDKFVKEVDGHVAEKEKAILSI